MTTRTTARRAANQRNSRQSIGPVTPAGKAMMRNNALRHGPTSKHVGPTSKHVDIDGEDPTEYEALRRDLLNDWNPATAHESQLVTDIAESYWRLLRDRRVEIQLFEMHMQDGPDPDAALAACFHANAREFDKLRRYTTTIERSYYRALAGLRNLQKERKKSAVGFVSQKRPQLPMPSLNSVPTVSNTPPEPAESGSVSQIPGVSQ